jgi:hypothetical protein
MAGGSLKLADQRVSTGFKLSLNVFFSEIDVQGTWKTDNLDSWFITCRHQGVP